MPGSGHQAADPDPPRTGHLARVRLIERRNSRPYGMGLRCYSRSWLYLQVH